MATEMSFFIDGRIVTIERTSGETNPEFAERSSFILAFRNDPAKFKLAQLLSYHHASKMFSGVTYRADIESMLKTLREEAKATAGTSL